MAEKYTPDEVALVQEVTSKVIFLLGERSEGLYLKKIDEDKPIRSLTELTTHFLQYLGTSLLIRLKLNVFQRRIGENQNPIINGLGTFVMFYFKLYFISKGLEKFNFRIKDSFYIDIVQSSFDNLQINRDFLGIVNDEKEYWSNDVKLIYEDNFLLNNGVCPMGRGEGGINLNKELKVEMLSFLDHFFTKRIEPYLDSSLAKNIDYMIIARGEFYRGPDVEHMLKNSHIFERIK